jgi:Zn-dependent protease with chaperone function
MNIGLSIFLIAIGAILAFATNLDVSGFDLDTIGVILMIVGAIGLLASVLFWSSFSPYGRRRDEVVVRDREIL